MRRFVQLVSLALYVLGCVYTASAQNVVTGTIHDPQGNPYANGNASAFLAVVSGQTQPPSTNVTTNGAGFFTMALATGSYSFTICAAPSQLPPVNPVANPTPRQVCFQSAPITISSNPQDVSATLNMIAPSLGPQGSQTGGSQTLSSLNNIIFVDGVTYQQSPDIGIGINAAYTACPLPGANSNSICKIVVPPNNPATNCYTVTTPIVLSTPGKPVLVDLSGSCIADASTSSHATITLDYMPSSGKISWNSMHGIINGGIFNLSGASSTLCTTNGGCGSLATGIQIGNTNYGAQRGTFEGLTIGGYGTGFANANTNSWGQHFNNNTWRYNNTAVALTAGPLENMMFDTNYWMVNGTAVTNTGAEVSFLSGGMDGQTTAGYVATAGSPTANFHGFHWENQNCGTQNCVHYINSGTFGQVNIYGGVVLDDTAGAANRDYLFTMNFFDIDGLTISSTSETFTNVVAVNGAGKAFWQNATPSIITNLCPASLSSSYLCVQWGTNTVPGLGQAMFSGNNAITSLPPANANATNLGWKFCFYQNIYCQGVTGNTEVHQIGNGTGSWLSVFAPGVPAGNASGTVPDTNALLSMGTAGIMVWKEVGAPTGPGTNFDGCYGDATLHALKCSYNNGTFFQVPQVITATSSTFATATTAGTCVQNTTAVAGAATSMAVSVSPVSTPGVGATWSGFVSSAGNVTITECATATSAGGTIAFNIRVTP